MLFSYIKSRKTVILVFFISLGIFTTVLFLYNMPLDAVVYASVLTLFFIFVTGVFDYIAFVRQHNILKKLQNGIAITDFMLPKPKNLIEEDYQQLIKILDKARTGAINEMDRKYRDMVDDYKSTYNTNDIANFFFITQDDYNRIKNTSVSLEDNELLLFVMRGKIPGDKISFNGLEMSIKERLSSFITVDRTTSVLAQDYYAVVKDVEAIKRVHNALFSEGDMGELSYWYGFDTDEDKDAEIQLAVSLWDSVKQVFKDAYLEGPELEREAFYTLYGGLFYLGIFLGLLFIMATVLIIYYKQLAEGIDDRNRFIIMQKVGMSHSEVKKSIRSQVLTVFFLPIGAAVVHLAFAFKVITKLLMIFNLNNVALYAGCTLLTIFAFVVFYAIVYALTSRTYYRIISA